MNNFQKEKNFISAVLYMNSTASCNELVDFCSKLVNFLSDNFLHFEIICVDDACDESYSLSLKSIPCFNNFSITVLHMSHYQGIEVAMNAGRDLSIGDFVFEFDDCRWNFTNDFILEAYNRCLQDIDIVCCTDVNKKNLASAAFYTIFNYYSDYKYKLSSDSFRILSRRSINRIQSLNRTVPYRKALYANSGLVMDSLTYSSTFSSKFKYDKKARKARKSLAVDSLILFTNVGYRFSLTFSLLMVSIMVLCALYALIVYINGIAIEGWTTTMLFLSFAFFGLFTILTIIIKYLSLLLNISFKRNRYLYSSVEKIK